MTTKRFVKLQFVLILMFTLTIICNTFSWSTRPAEQGGAYMTTATELNNGISYWTALQLDTPTYYINGNSCTAVTYTADVDGSGNALFNKQGNVIYDETTPISSATELTLGPDDVYYFKTVITNSTAVTTNIIHVTTFCQWSYKNAVCRHAGESKIWKSARNAFCHGTWGAKGTSTGANNDTIQIFCT